MNVHNDERLQRHDEVVQGMRMMALFIFNTCTPNDHCGMYERKQGE
jgi:hypothetical protein